jgi:thiamine pyrophosphate-dependent acetolactate synthase large subunit-like protein
MPIEFQWLDVDYQPVLVRLPERRALTPESTDLDNAIGIIAAAKRPIVLAGRGAASSAARAALVRLAARTDALLATTLKAKDLFAGEDFNLGVFGTLSSPVAVDAIMESDCVVAFGASLNQNTSSSGTFLKGKRVVQCNAELDDVARNLSPDASLIGEAALMADTIVHWLDEAEIAPSGFRNDELRRRLADYSPAAEIDDRSTETTIDVRTAIARFDKAVPAERILVTDAGRFVAAPWKMIGVADPTAFLFTINFGCVGLGMAYAIGASYAHPGRPVLLVIGDGGLMLGGLAEFNTAVRHKVDLIVMVCNDGSYGAEYVQWRDKGMDPSLSLFDWPEFAVVAEALGGRGVTVRTAQDLEAAAEAIATRERPLLVDIKLDPDNMPDRTG